MQFFTEASLDFQERISQRNGLGNCTYFPPSLHEEPPECNMNTAREEAELVLFGVVQEVLDKTGQLLPQLASSGVVTHEDAVLISAPCCMAMLCALAPVIRGCVVAKGITLTCND